MIRIYGSAPFLLLRFLLSFFPLSPLPQHAGIRVSFPRGHFRVFPSPPPSLDCPLINVLGMCFVSWNDVAMPRAKCRTELSSRIRNSVRSLVVFILFDSSPSLLGGSKCQISLQKITYKNRSLNSFNSLRPKNPKISMNHRIHLVPCRLSNETNTKSFEIHGKNSIAFHSIVANA